VAIKLIVRKKNLNSQIELPGFKAYAGLGKEILFIKVSPVSGSQQIIHT
jgi:hypothetical protein